MGEFSRVVRKAKGSLERNRATTGGGQAPRGEDPDRAGAEIGAPARSIAWSLDS